MDKAQYQLVIVGAGPAGLSAGLYAARGRMQALLIEKGAAGGQALSTDWIENYPGFVDGVSGFELMGKMEAHAERFGLEKKSGVITAMELQGRVKRIVLESGEEISAHTVILCTGARPKRLGIPGEQEFSGRGVSYCATCDGPFYRGKDVAVVGGGDTAVSDALYLARFASRVYVVHRRDALRAAKVLQEAAFREEKIEFVYDSVPEAFCGETAVEGLSVKHVKTGSLRMLAVSAVFVAVGIVPETALVRGQVELDAAGAIVTDAQMRCSVPGVFAAGDVRNTPLRQVVTACADGAVAATSALDYLAQLRS